MSNILYLTKVESKLVNSALALCFCKLVEKLKEFDLNNTSITKDI